MLCLWPWTAWQDNTTWDIEQKFLLQQSDVPTVHDDLVEEIRSCITKGVKVRVRFWISVICCLKSNTYGWEFFSKKSKRLEGPIKFKWSRASIQIIQFLIQFSIGFNPLNAELNPICCLLALLGVHNFLHVSRIRVKSLTLRLLMSYIYIYIWD
jgi:hypothetical protein